MLYDALGLNTARRGPSPVASVRHGRGNKFESSVTIQRPRAELYRFWRNFENLPRFMVHLDRVQVLDGRRSRWRVKGPANTYVEWEAELYNEREPELIAWRSLPNSDVRHAGTVQFREVQGGTEVLVTVSYEPPAGKLGQAVARLFGEEPEQQIREDLDRLTRLLEGTDVPRDMGRDVARSPVPPLVRPSSPV
jgi:uncharacterized membrane protein